MTRSGRRAGLAARAVPLLAAVLLAAALAPATASARRGTPPPTTQPDEQTPPSTVPPVITTPESDGPTRLTLASQPSWVAAESSITFGLRIEGPTNDGMTINVIAHQFVDSRIRFDRALRGEQLPSVAGQVIQVPIALAPPDGSGVRTLTFGLQTVADRDPNRLALRTTDADVFPVEIELRDAEGNQLSGFVTPVVVVAPGPAGTPTIGRPLNVAWVWPLADRPAFLPDLSPDPEVVAALGSDGRIGGAALRIDNHDVPVTIAPGPETLEAWQLLGANNPDIEGTLAALRGSLPTSQVLNSPYVPIDVPSLADGGFGAEIAAELRKGVDTLQRGLAVSVDQSTAVVDPVDDAAVTRLRAEGVTRFVVEDRALVPRADNLTPARPFLLQSESRNVTAVASDSGLARLLEGPDPPALRAQRFLAALAVVAVELPNVERGVVVLNPADGPPDLQVLNLALTGLAQENPLVDPVPLDDLFDVPLAVDDASGATIERELAPITPAAPPVTPAQYRTTAGALAGYKSLLAVPDTGLSQRGDKALLVALSSAWENPEGRARASAELTAVTDGINAFIGQIHVPVNPTITVTASTAEIPVTFLNDNDETVRVRVSLASDELTFPDGDERVLDLPPRNTTFRFAIEARGSGTFPLSLQVTSPDGLLQLQQTEVQVRSTFVSNVGVFLTVGAGLFLALWWGNDFRKRRKRKAVAATPDPSTAAQAPPAATPGAPR